MIEIRDQLIQFHHCIWNLGVSECLKEKHDNVVPSIYLLIIIILYSFIW